MQPSPIRLLAYSPEPNMAPALEGRLRGAGIAAQVGWQDAGLLPVLDDRQSAWDLIVCPPQLRARAQSVVDRSPFECAVLVIDELSHDDQLSLDDEKLSVVCRELALDVRDRRRIRQLEAENLALRARVDRLRDDVGLPAARISQGIIIEANHAWAHMLGVRAIEDLAGAPFLDFVVPHDRARIKAVLNRLEHKAPLRDQLIFEALRADSGTIGLKLHAESELADDINTVELTGQAVGSSDDRNPIVLGRLRLNRELSLWQLPAGAQGGLLNCRIHDFASLEDRAGFADAALIADELEGCLRRELSDGDMLFRFAIDSFAVLARRPHFEQLTQLAECLQKSIDEQVFRSGLASISIAMATEVLALPNRVLPESVMRCLRSSTGVLADHNLAAADWPERIRSALAQNRFKLAYQPLTPLRGGTANFDVFVRLVDPDGTEHPLREFYDDAEQAGLLPLIDRWTIDNAIWVLRQRSASESRMFIKLSGDSVRQDQDLVKWLKRKLCGHPEAYRYLVLEMAEDVVGVHPRAALRLADGLKFLGAEVGMFRARGENPDVVQPLPLDWIRIDPACEPALSGLIPIPEEFDDLLNFAQNNNIQISAPRIAAAQGLARLWRWGVAFMEGEAVQCENMVLGADTLTG